MSKKSICIQKLRILFFELHTLKTEISIIINLAEVHSIDKLLVLLARSFLHLSNTQKIFQTLNNELEKKINELEELNKVEKILDHNLIKLSSFRKKIFNYLMHEVFNKNTEDTLLFLSLQNIIDNIYLFFNNHLNNSSYDIPDELKTKFSSMVDNIAIILKTSNHITVNSIINSKPIFEKLILYWSLKLWHRKLFSFKQAPYSQDTIELIHSINDVKYAFYCSFIKNNNTPGMLQEFINCIKSQQKILLPHQIIELLENQSNQLRVDINNIELKLKSLIQPTSYMQKSLSLFKQTFYYKLAENYMNMSNKFTQEKFANIPVLNTSLSRPYVESFSLILAGSMISIELYNRSWLGAPYNIISVMANMLLNFNMVSATYVRLKSHELKAAQHMNYLKQVIQFLLGFMLFALSGSVSSNIFIFAGGYIFALGMQFLFSNAFDNFTVPNSKNNSNHALSFLSYIVQLVGLAAGTFLWRQVLKTSKYSSNHISKENVLSNKEQCLAHPIECKEEALKVLGLENQEVNLEIVNQQYRKLARLHHPDKVKNYQNSNKFFKLTEARIRWLELQPQLQPSVSIFNAESTNNNKLCIN